MKIETYLNAMNDATDDMSWLSSNMQFNPQNIYTIQYQRRQRQYHAFHARILRMFEELRYENFLLQERIEVLELLEVL